MNITYRHTNLIAQDWQTLAQFYQDVFGCVPVPPTRKQSGAWLERGTGVPNATLEGVHLRLPGYGDSGPTLEVFQYEQMEDKPAPAANRRGYGHLAFEVDDVAEMRKRILDHGGQDLGEIAETDVPGVGRLVFTYITDPEGNILEIQRWS